VSFLFQIFQGLLGQQEYTESEARGRVNMELKSKNELCGDEHLTWEGSEPLVRGGM
jgi:hypothetical protein